MIDEDEIDHLYQLPLGEFTAARAALAKRAGNRGEEVSKLEKPNAAAWGVNQLYWRRRKTFEKLTAAFEVVRAAQAWLLSGKPADLPRAETAHRAALADALDEIRQLLTEAGDAASPATMAAISETLQVLPFSSTNGRLTRPLQPVGFGALAGLMGAVAANPRVAEVVSIDKGRRPARAETPKDAEQKQRAAERRAEVARVEFELAAARKAEIAADAKAAGAENDARRAKKVCERLRAELDGAEGEARERAEEATVRSRQAREATAARERLEEELQRLRSRN